MLLPLHDERVLEGQQARSVLMVDGYEALLRAGGGGDDGMVRDGSPTHATGAE